MGGVGGYRYVGIDIILVRVISARKSLRKIFTLIIIGLILSDCLVSCVLRFAYYVFNFAKN